MTSIRIYYNSVEKNSTYESFIYGGIAQLARAHGSYPWCHGFKSLFRYFGRLAQLGEHLPYKQGVIGSSPIATT